MGTFLGISDWTLSKICQRKDYLVSFDRGCSSLHFEFARHRSSSSHPSQLCQPLWGTSTSLGRVCSTLRARQNGTPGTRRREWLKTRPRRSTSPSQKRCSRSTAPDPKPVFEIQPHVLNW